MLTLELLPHVISANIGVTSRLICVQLQCERRSKISYYPLRLFGMLRRTFVDSPVGELARSWRDVDLLVADLPRSWRDVDLPVVNLGQSWRGVAC